MESHSDVAKKNTPIRNYIKDHKIKVGAAVLLCGLGLELLLDQFYVMGIQYEKDMAAEKPAVSIIDFNGDGKKDYLISDPGSRTGVGFISKDSGYVKATLKVQDGYPFYMIDGGYYDYTGKFYKTTK